MLSQSFCLKELCVCSLRGDIRELAANPFSEHMQTFLFAFHSHQHHLSLKGFLDEGGNDGTFLFVNSITSCMPDKTDRLAGGTSDVYQPCKEITAASSSSDAPF